MLSEAILSERQVDNHLNAILAKRSNVERGLANLKDSLGLLGLMQKHAESIAGSTKHASDLAEDVSRRVRELDASQSRGEATVMLSSRPQLAGTSSTTRPRTVSTLDSCALGTMTGSVGQAASFER